jgi:hypothetical protein
LPLAEVDFYLDRQGVAPELRERIADLAGTFGKRHTHMLGADVGHPPSFTVFFTAHLAPGDDQADRHALQEALKHTGVPEQGIAAFLPLHRLLGANRPKTLYFSCRISGQAAVTHAKIDYAAVRLGLVSEVMAALGLEAQLDLPIQWGNHLRLRNASYAGVIVGPTGPNALRAYFVRRLARNSLVAGVGTP